MTQNIRKQELLKEKSSFYDYILNVSKKDIHRLILIICLFIMVLLITEIMLLKDSQSKISAVVVKIAVMAILIVMDFTANKIKTFKRYAVLISAGETAVFLLMLYILKICTYPSFFLQTFGIVIFIVALFVIPNYGINNLIISIFACVSFYICSYLFIDEIEMLEFSIAIIYTSVITIICALSAQKSINHHFEEFIAKRKLEQISQTDYLTQTANRYKFVGEAKKWIKFCRQQNLPLSLVFIDVDNLKVINDQYGHSAGDMALTDMSRLINSQLRDTDILARWGGDEFLILMPDTGLDAAVVLSQQIRSKIKEEVTIEKMNMTCSFGVVQIDNDADFDQMIERADKLMYKAKNSGRDNIKWNL